MTTHSHDDAAFMRYWKAVCQRDASFEEATREELARAAVAFPELHAAFMQDREAGRIEQENKRRQAEYESWLLQSWQAKAGRFSGASLDNFAEHGSEQERTRQRSVLEKLRDLDLRGLVETGANLMFLGPCGTGKDHLMHALAQRVHRGTRGQVVLCNGSRLRRDLKSAAFANQDGELITKHAVAQLLCISDPVPATAADLTAFQADALYEIVDRRWHDRKPTWITANLPAQGTREIAEKILSVPVWDRLKDNAIVVRCDWSSFRRHADFIE